MFKAWARHADGAKEAEMEAAPASERLKSTYQLEFPEFVLQNVEQLFGSEGVPRTPLLCIAILTFPLVPGTSYQVNVL